LLIRLQRDCWVEQWMLRLILKLELLWGHAITQVVSCWLLTTGACVCTQSSPCGICSGQSGTGTGLSQSSLVSPPLILFHHCSLTHVIIWPVSSYSPIDTVSPIHNNNSKNNRTVVTGRTTQTVPHTVLSVLTEYVQSAAGCS
jgi:hypothetical protein